jgi:SAM-dependent methyltransferase
LLCFPKAKNKKGVFPTFSLPLRCQADQPRGNAMTASVANPTATTQDAINAYFAGETGYWAGVYERQGVRELVCQERLQLVLGLAERMGLPPGTRALDVGCGAGLAAAGLARLGLAVDAIDPVPGMVDATRRRAAESGLDVTTRLGDIHALPFPDATFGLVAAIGVLPWLPTLDAPLREVRRVLRPGGRFVVTIDNCWALRYVADPLTSPLLRRPRKLAARFFPWARPAALGARSRLVSIAACEAALRAEGLEREGGVSLGFGPITAFHRDLLPAAVGVKLHAFLQRLADRDLPVIRSAGFQYIVWGRRPG